LTNILKNFFSTQFIQTDDGGHMKLSVDTWLLAAIALPMTAVTIILWWAWVYFAKVIVPPVLSPQESTIMKRQSSFFSFTTSKKKKQPVDEESGLRAPQSPTGTFRAPLFCQDSGANTWTTTATTIKAE
jgi:hypothetical protein